MIGQTHQATRGNRKEPWTISRNRLPAHHAGTQTWRPTSDRKSTHHVGIANRSSLMRMLGKGIQRSQHQPILCHGTLLLRHYQLVSGFANHIRCGIRLEIGADASRIRRHRLGLGNHIKRTPFRNKQRDAHERLQTTSETRFGSTHTFGDGADFAMVTCQQSDDTISFAKFDGTQDHALVLIQRHSHTSFASTRFLN